MSFNQENINAGCNGRRVARLEAGCRRTSLGVKHRGVVAMLMLALSLVSLGNNRAAAQLKPRAQQEAKTPQTAAAANQPTRAQSEEWRRAMQKSQRPKKGCFVATYPQRTWKEAQCVTPRLVLFRPRRGIRPFTVGNGTDFSAQVTANTSAAEGSFDSIPGVTSESGSGTANKYSLQLNTNFFSTTTCAGAAVPSACQGWEQFIYSSVTLGQILIQYWMLNYNNPCPAPWSSDGQGDCVVNNAMAMPVSPVVPVTSLDKVTLTGDISDQVTLTVNNTTMFSAPGDNRFPDLSAGWRTSEFNVIGDANFSSADFNPGSTMVVRTRVNSGTPALPPSCVVTGFTGETNNLTLVSTPVAEPDVNWPSIIFVQSNVNPVTPASCDTADSIGDTHLRTFDGLAYDFQASGDFVVAKAANFEVQARQASGAPNWPNAAVNKAVAVEMGKTRVALYVEPARLTVDGHPENLADGKSILLPDGVQVSRRDGNQYEISSLSGDRVYVTLNITPKESWIDYHVGMGHTPRPEARGLLGTPGGNGQQLRTINGAVLQKPVAFGDLYGSYAIGWRVRPNESLFSEKTTIVAAMPTHPFFVSDLKPEDAARATAACKAAGVAPGAHFENCVLDHAVFNHEVATRAFLHATPPRVVIKPELRQPILPVERETKGTP